MNKTDGVTLLAGIKQARPELVIGELFGAGIFVTMVVAGSVFLTASFTSMKRPILRDMIFYLFAAFFAWATVWHGSITFWHATIFIIIYIVYLITVIMGRFIHQKMKQQAGNGKYSIDISINRFQYFKKSIDVDKPHHPTNSSTYETDANTNMRPDYNYNTVQSGEQSNSGLKNVLISNVIDNNQFGVDNPAFISTGSEAALDTKQNIGRRMSYSVHHHFDNTVYHIAQSIEQEDAQTCTNPECDCQIKQQNNQFNHNIQRVTGSIVSTCSNLSTGNSVPNFHSQSLASSQSNLKNLNEIQDFLIHICPFDLNEWKSSSILSKLYQIIKAPICFVLVITIPVIDYENDRDNWCRILNSIQLITSPMVILYVSGVYQYVFDNLICLGITISLCILLAICVFLFTNHLQAPRFHYLYGFLGFFVSMLWIYALATETISLLHVFGIMLDLSDFILGLTVLAFGNSIGDLMSNISMARNGFARMGISASYGGPLFNLLFGIGMPYCILLYNDRQMRVPINYSKMVSLSFGTVAVGLLTTMFLLIASDFKSKKWHGFILLGIYLVYVGSACLIEFDYI